MQVFKYNANHTFAQGHIDFDVHDLIAWVGIYFFYFWWINVKNYLWMLYSRQ
jgi:hypothetical protein